MAKRTSFLAKLEQELPETPEPAAPSARGAAPEPKLPAKPPAKPDVVKSTIYIPPAVHQRLREIAFTEHRRVHDLIMEGLDRVLEDRGHPERTGDRKG